VPNILLSLVLSLTFLPKTVLSVLGISEFVIIATIVLLSPYLFLYHPLFPHNTYHYQVEVPNYRIIAQAHPPTGICLH